MNMARRTGSHFDRILLSILLLCLILRLAYCFLVFPIIGERLYWKGVDDGYDELARNMLHGEGYTNVAGGFPNLVTPPGYAFFLYGLYRLVGEEINEGVRIQVVQPLLDTATCFLVYLLGVRLFRKRAVGLLAALGWALYPQIIVYNARVATEVLFTLLLTWAIVALYHLYERNRLRDAICMGILFGMAMLVKEKLIFFPPFLLYLILRSGRAHSKRWWSLAVVTIIFITLPVVPWIVRGYQTTGLFVPITLRQGRALNHGMNEDFSGADDAMVRFFENRPEGNRTKPELGEEERSAGARKIARDEQAHVARALSRITADPWHFIRGATVKLAAFWYYGQPRVIWGNILIQIPILLLAIAGYIRGWRKYDLVPFLLLTLYFDTLHSVTITRMRYSIPIMPETILLAAYFLVSTIGHRITIPRRFQNLLTRKSTC